MYCIPARESARVRLCMILSEDSLVRRSHSVVIVSGDARCIRELPRVVSLAALVVSIIRRHNVTFNQKCPSVLSGSAAIGGKPPRPAWFYLGFYFQSQFQVDVCSLRWSRCAKRSVGDYVLALLAFAAPSLFKSVRTVRSAVVGRVWRRAPS